MKKKRFAVEQVVAVFKQAKKGVPVAGMTRQIGIPGQALYRWKNAVHGAAVGSGSRAETAAGRDARLKKLVADLSLAKATAQDIHQKIVRPALKRPMVDYIVSHYGVVSGGPAD